MSATPAPIRAFEYWLTAYKSKWRGTIVSGFLSPVLFLAAMGLGLGSFVDKSGTGSARLDNLDYLVFLAPGLLAATAMQIAAMEATYPVMGGVKWIKTYHGQLATPLGVDDVLIGHLFFMAFRLFLSAVMYLVVMAMFSATKSWSALLGVPAAVLTGMAFATPIAAFSATRETDGAISGLTRFVIVPMFLFSGTFYPVTQLPAAGRVIAYLTPLWHGVDLCRGLSLGTASLVRTAGHVGYLLLFVAAGFVASRRSFRKVLAT